MRLRDCFVADRWLIKSFKLYLICYIYITLDIIKNEIIYPLSYLNKLIIR